MHFGIVCEYMYDTRDGDFFDTDEGAFDTIMENDIVFRGTMRVKKPFMIRGSVSGQIEAASTLVIDSQAEVRANIKAQKVLIRGYVTGNIEAASMVFLTPTAKLTGDIKASQVVLEPGCVFSGRCDMTAASAAE